LCRPVGRAGLQRLHASLAVIVSKRRFHHAGAAAAASRQDGSCAPESTSRGSVAARSPNPPAPKRYAVIGGGFAGVAVAFHLLSRASHTHPISLDLYEAFGLGAGGSGAAAGLLHPYTTRGKVRSAVLPSVSTSLLEQICALTTNPHLGRDIPYAISLPRG